MTDKPKGKPRGKPFEAGNNASPGPPRLTEEERALRKITKTNFQKAVRKYLTCTKQELLDVAKDPKTEAMDLLIVSVMMKAITTGDEKKMEWFLFQLFGQSKKGFYLTNGERPENKNDIDLSKLNQDQLEQLKLIAEVSSSENTEH